MSQPKWKLVANIGDVNPFEHGGVFIFKDTTGVYDPEILFIDPLEDIPQVANTYRVVMDIVTKESIQDEFWGDSNDIEGVAGFIGQTSQQFIDDITSDDLVRRGFAWDALVKYYGPQNFGECPDLTKISDLRRKYGRLKALKNS